MKKVLAIILALVLVLSMTACGGAKKDDGLKTIGILMPTKEQTIWSIQGDRLVAGYQAAGYATEIEFAEDDSARQATQIENMISKGVDALVVVAVDGAALTDACEKAKEAGIRDSVKIMVGGAPVDQRFCDHIGADAYTRDAASAADAAAAFRGK